MMMVLGLYVFMLRTVPYQELSINAAGDMRQTAG